MGFNYIEAGIAHQFVLSTVDICDLKDVRKAPIDNKKRSFNSMRPSDAYLRQLITIIGSGNVLVPGRRQAIIWTNAGILLIGNLRTNFCEILSEIDTFSILK